MLNSYVPKEVPVPEWIEQQLVIEKDKLEKNQIEVMERKLPVIVLMEGFEGAGKGSALRKILMNLDPRSFSVDVLKPPTEDESKKPFMYRHFVKIPENGHFSFLLKGWMSDITDERLAGGGKKLFEKRIKRANSFERQLTDNGYLIIKLFFNISRKEQKKRFEALLRDDATKWRVQKEDKWQNEHYDKAVKIFNEYLDANDTEKCPWTIIDANGRKWAQLQAISKINREIEKALKKTTADFVDIGIINPDVCKITPLEEVKLDKELSMEEYDKLLDEYQNRLSYLHNELYKKKIPVVIAYEGWDAAGKGGNIKRITSALDPRGYEVFPIASPTKPEKERHFLWRFYNRLPKEGHIAIFDRTWYGRVMVERIEGFCSENDWKRAYEEINEFEKELTDWGAIVIKFWVQIDKDTQLERFNDRQNTPEKQWKITDEDWRNREKWDAYEVAVNEMLKKTNTSYAPWTILESNDKKYARIKALRTVINEIEKRIEQL